MNQGVRHGLYIIFAILVIGIGTTFLKMSYFEALLICCCGMVIIKLTDIEEKIEK